jgi:putative Mg2+ transporter-C (MgtC) family protein
MPLVEVALRLSIAGLLGSLLGLEREVRGHPAGARTHAFVAIGAALFTLIGIVGFGGQSDPSRVAAQVVSGIGFVGAGAILHHGTNVRGLTTAATLWTSAALGLAAGAGAYREAVIGGVVVLAFGLVLHFLKPLAAKLSTRTLLIEYEQGHGTLGPVIRELEQLNGRIVSLHLDDEADPVAGRKVRRATIGVTTKAEGDLSRLMAAVCQRPEVHAARLTTNGEAVT